MRCTVWEGVWVLSDESLRHPCVFALIPHSLPLRQSLLLFCGGGRDRVCPPLFAVPALECAAVELVGRALFSQGLERELWECRGPLDQALVVPEFIR